MKRRRSRYGSGKPSVNSQPMERRSKATEASVIDECWLVRRGRPMENAMKNSMKWAVLVLAMPLLAACGDDAAIADPEPCQAGFFSADGLEPCAAATECEATEYEVRAPSETSDRHCELLTLCSLEGCESLAPTSTSDGTCSPLTTCKFYEAEISPPTPT